MVTPSARKAGVRHLVGHGIVSERRACHVVEVSRSCVRYVRRSTPQEAALRQEIRSLAGRHKRFGYRRIAALLRRKGIEVNTKRVHRIWKAEGLSLPARRPRRRRCGPKGEVIRKAQRPNHVWTYDFMEDRTERGGRLKILTVLDEYTRESLAIRVERSVDSHRVIGTLARLVRQRGAPDHIRSDNGPEFVAQAVQAWLTARGARTIFITPGSPWENAYIESFNGKLRDECLNMEVFRSGKEAQMMAEAWRKDYNEHRPHSSLGYLTPAEFADRSGSSSRATPSFRFQNESTRALTLTL